MSNAVFSIDPLEPRQLMTALTPAVTTTSSITTLGQTKNWTVPLVAGRQFVLAIADMGTTTFAPLVQLYNPSGVLVATATGDKGAVMNINAPVTGTYRVRVRDNGDNQTGSVKLTAFYYANPITDSDDAFTEQSGRRFAATIEPGDLDVWTFPATRGMFMSVLCAENIPGNATTFGLILISPTGKVVQQKTNPTGMKIDVPGTSSVSGNYYAIVYEDGQDATGRYGISFAATPGTQYAGDPDTVTPLSPGVVRNGDLPGGDMDIWGVSLKANQKISITIKRLTSSLDPELLLVGPTGAIVASANGSPNATLTTTVSAAGTYWIIARDREADDGGQFSIVYTVT